MCLKVRTRDGIWNRPAWTGSIIVSNIWWGVKERDRMVHVLWIEADLKQ